MEGSHFFTLLPGCLHTRRSILHSPHAAYTSDHPPKKWSEATVIRTWCYCPKPSCQSCLTQHIRLVCLVRKLIYIKKQHKVKKSKSSMVPSKLRQKCHSWWAWAVKSARKGRPMKRFGEAEANTGPRAPLAEGSPQMVQRAPLQELAGTGKKDTHWQGCGGIFSLISIVYLFISRSLHYLQYMSIEILQFLWCKQ